MASQPTPPPKRTPLRNYKVQPLPKTSRIDIEKLLVNLHPPNLPSLSLIRVS